ncbi:MAG: hypothetical protein D6769_03175 [Methanobacteriota archaeon]|nr:MAG: hypothetical protein D6769_03175 [Euryarchaeota archaeon]
MVFTLMNLMTTKNGLRPLAILLFSMLLTSSIFATLSVESIATEITLANNGNAHVVERVTIKMDNELDVVDYNKAAESNTLQNWVKALNNPDIRLHIDPSKANIENLRISPQPVRTDFFNEFTAKILITYDVLNTGEANSSLFLKEVVKPRVVKYKLNPKLLSYKRTNAGNLILGDNVALIMNFPQGSSITDINPVPKNVKELSLPAKMEQVYWRNQILVGMRLEVVVEESIADEISNYFESLLSTFGNVMESSEGKVYAVLLTLLVASYLYLISKLKGGAKKKRRERKEKKR